jgi:hypothetical protein
MLGVGLLAAVATFWVPWTRNNFGVVDPGLVFRSAQPGEEIEDTVRTVRLASVLNLRGGSMDDPFYVREVRASRDLGVAFYDFPMSATRRPTRRELLTLLDLFERCRYPLLIHCKSGSDRTGLASALYLLSRRGESQARALREFTVRHGHVPLGGTERLHEPFDEYASWLQAAGLPHTPGRFRAWVEHDYRDDDLAVEITPLRPGPRVRHATSRPD